MLMSVSNYCIRTHPSRVLAILLAIDSDIPYAQFSEAKLKLVF